MIKHILADKPYSIIICTTKIRLSMKEDDQHCIPFYKHKMQTWHITNAKKYFFYGHISGKLHIAKYLHIANFEHVRNNLD